MDELTPETVTRESILEILVEKKVDLSSVIESPMLYSSRQTFTKILTRIELFKKIHQVQGSIVECGVYKADSLMTFFQMSCIHEPYSFTRKIIGFDSFEGFPHVSERDQDTFAKVAHLNDVDYGLIKSIVQLQERNKAIPNISKIELIKGDALKTIPHYVDINPHLIVSLLFLDFDLYEPTKVALEYLLPRVPKGGIVAFDELNQSKWKGETQAFEEIIGIRHVKLKKFSFDPHVSYFEVT